jgi:hypothetical protein
MTQEQWDGSLPTNSVETAMSGGAWNRFLRMRMQMFYGTGDVQVGGWRERMDRVDEVLVKLAMSKSCEGRDPSHRPSLKATEA